VNILSPDSNGRLLTGLKGYVFSRAHGVTANGGASPAGLKKIGADASRSRRIPMGIRARSTEPDQASVANNHAQFRMRGGTALIFAERRVRKKELRELIEAIEVLTPSSPT
jgi:hypothetical protein